MSDGAADGADGAGRWTVLEAILRDVRQEVLPARMVEAALEGLMPALGGVGAAVLDLLVAPDADPVLHAAGAEAGALVPGLVAALAVEAADPVETTVAGYAVLACPAYTKFGGRAGLCVWRDAGPVWQAGDAALLSSVTAVMRMLLEHEAIQLELARQARTDPLTGLLNRVAFLEEVGRRIGRLDREALPAALLVVDLDGLRRVNDACGFEAGDSALAEAAALLRRTVRPADIVARTGGDGFALWLDGSDELTAAERAEQLRVNGPDVFRRCLPREAPALCASTGVAARYPGSDETVEDLLMRADMALAEAKRGGPGRWRVSHGPLA